MKKLLIPLALTIGLAACASQASLFNTCNGAYSALNSLRLVKDDMSDGDLLQVRALKAVMDDICIEGNFNVEADAITRIQNVLLELQKVEAKTP